MKSTTKTHCCPFNFTFMLYHDIVSWVLIAGTGSCKHKFHPKSNGELLPSLRETPQMIKNEALDFFEATNSPATAATIIHFRIGLELTSSQLNYLKRKQDNSEEIEHKRSVDNLLAYF